jgi:hypothetical protein
MYGPRRPSRILNDSRFVLGITLTDFGFSVGIFVVLARFLNETPYALMSFVGAVLFCLVLIPIRIKHREHIIRDLLAKTLARGRFS